MRARKQIHKKAKVITIMCFYNRLSYYVNGDTMSLYNIKTERGLFITRPMQEREVILNILLDLQQHIELRHHNEEQNKKEHWKDWRAFPEIEKHIEKICASPKVPYSYALGTYTPHQIKEYRSIYSYKGFLHLEEVFLLYAYHNKPQDRCFIQDPKTQRWMSVYQYLNPEERENPQIEGLPFVDSHALCTSIVGDEPESIRQSMLIIEDFFDLLIHKLTEKQRIQFSKLGTFSLATHPSRVIKTPKQATNTSFRCTKPDQFKVRVTPERKSLCFTPCKSLKDILKKEGSEAPLQLHFGGDNNPTASALLWSKQRGNLSTRRQFAQEIASKRQFPIAFVSKVVHGLLQKIGECIAKDIPISLSSIISIYTQWWSGYQSGAVQEKRIHVEPHRRVLIHQEKRFIQKNKLSHYPLYNPLNIDFSLINCSKKSYLKYRYIDRVYLSWFYDIHKDFRLLKGFSQISAQLKEFASDPTVTIGPDVWHDLTDMQKKIHSLGSSLDIYEMSHVDIMTGFVHIEPGTFFMGEDQSEVTLTRPFWVMKYLVPDYLYNLTFNRKKNFSARAKININYYDALRFCNTLSKKYNLEPVYILKGHNLFSLVDYNTNANGFRLLTEAEWEYCAKAGEDTLYAGSNDHTEVAVTGIHTWDSDSQDWTIDTRYTSNFNPKRPKSLGTQKPNAWGLYDMSGLFSEWVFDLYSDTVPSGIDPVNKDADNFFIPNTRRSGSYYEIPPHSMITRRRPVKPIAGDLLSFRIARNA